MIDRPELRIRIPFEGSPVLSIVAANEEEELKLEAWLESKARVWDIYEAAERWDEPV